MAWGRRCDLGCETWPDQELYRKCPVCGEKTDRFSNAGSDLLDEAEALVKLLYSQFEEYYRRWDSQRDPRRLDPAGLGSKYDREALVAG